MIVPSLATSASATRVRHSARSATVAPTNPRHAPPAPPSPPKPSHNSANASSRAMTNDARSKASNSSVPIACSPPRPSSPWSAPSPRPASPSARRSARRSHPRAFPVPRRRRHPPHRVPERASRSHIERVPAGLRALRWRPCPSSRSFAFLLGDWQTRGRAPRVPHEPPRVVRVAVNVVVVVTVVTVVVRIRVVGSHGWMFGTFACVGRGLERVRHPVEGDARDDFVRRASRCAPARARRGRSRTAGRARRGRLASWCAWYRMDA